VATGDGEVRCDEVVVAAGPWTADIARTVGLDVPLTVTREQVLILDPPADFADEHPDLTPTTALPGGDWYVRPDFGGGVLVATHHTGDGVDPDGYEERPARASVLALIDSLAECIPGLAEAGPKAQYSGSYTPSLVPAFF
jgi:glycine/D-amino acid oxidase-like deaminating enzyme